MLLKAETSTSARVACISAHSASVRSPSVGVVESWGRPLRRGVADDGSGPRVERERRRAARVASLFVVVDGGGGTRETEEALREGGFWKSEGGGGRWG